MIAAVLVGLGVVGILLLLAGLAGRNRPSRKDDSGGGDSSVGWNDGGPSAAGCDSGGDGVGCD
jgi:hypothetical protein